MGMKIKDVILAFLVLVFSLFAQEKQNIAVMEIEGNGVSEINIAGLSNRLRTELFKTGKYNVIERSRMNEAPKEQGFQQAGCTNTECAVEIGQLIGVEKIVVGSVDVVGVAGGLLRIISTIHANKTVVDKYKKISIQPHITNENYSFKLNCHF